MTGSGPSEVTYVDQRKPGLHVREASNEAFRPGWDYCALPDHSILKSNIAGMVHFTALEAIYQDWTDCLGIYNWRKGMNWYILSIDFTESDHATRTLVYTGFGPKKGDRNAYNSVRIKKLQNTEEIFYIIIEEFNISQPIWRWRSADKILNAQRFITEVYLFFWGLLIDNETCYH